MLLKMIKFFTGKNYLNTRVGIFSYLLYRNDKTWKLLSDEEKQRVFRSNFTENTTRDDYADPNLYGGIRVSGGEVWDSLESRNKSLRGKMINQILQTNQPKNVLEIGPGPGFFTRTICEFGSVKSYTALEMGRAFIDYLQPRMKVISDKKPFGFNLVKGFDISVLDGQKFDFIVILSAVHHIPNREDLF